MVRTDGGGIDVLDKAADAALNKAAGELAQRMEHLYDMANRARRMVSKRNRQRTSNKAVPNIDVGDFVLYAEYEKQSKLDYTWLGPAVVTDIVTPLVYTIRPYTLYASEERDVHICRLRRFAGSGLHMTEQLQLSVQRDMPDNIVGKIVSHQVDNGTLWMMCRWKGFTSELDSLQRASILAEDCPDKVIEYFKKAPPDERLTSFMQKVFPSLEHEQEVARQRRKTGAIATGMRAQLRRKGRTRAQLTKRTAMRSAPMKKPTRRKRVYNQRTQSAPTPTLDAENMRAQRREADNAARAIRRIKRGQRASSKAVVPATAEVPCENSIREAYGDTQAVIRAIAASYLEAQRRTALFMTVAERRKFMAKVLDLTRGHHPEAKDHRDDDDVADEAWSPANVGGDGRATPATVHTATRTDKGSDAHQTPAETQRSSATALAVYAPDDRS